MPSLKRPRESGASSVEQQEQDPPAVVPGLGALLSLVVDRVSKATASMFWRRTKKLRRQSSQEYGPESVSSQQPTPPGSTTSETNAAHGAGVASAGAAAPALSMETTPSACMETPCGIGVENVNAVHQARSALTSTSIGRPASISFSGSRVCQTCGERTAGTQTPPPTERGGPFPRHLLEPLDIGEGVKLGAEGSVIGVGKMAVLEGNGVCHEGPRVGLKRKADWGLPQFFDTDSLRHALSFLSAMELARFALASSVAREFVMDHASSEIVRRYSRIQVGIREQQAPVSPSRCLFATAVGTASATGDGDGGSGSGSGSAGAPQGSSSPRGAQYQRFGGERSGRRGCGSMGGEGRGSSRRRRVRAKGSGGLARYNVDTARLVLGALYHLEACGELLQTQLKTLPRMDMFKTLQSRAVLGDTQFLTPHMRAVLVDWMVEVAFQFRLSTIALHAAVSALDVCLGKVAVPRCRLQLLGVVCAMIQSQAGGGCQVMTTTEAIHICDSQYNPAQVHSTFNIVVSNTQDATARTIPATAAQILHRHLVHMGEPSGLKQPLSSEWGKCPEVKEVCVLSGLLIDLSMLDKEMFRFMPGTLAAAALFLARATAIFYSKEEVMITPHAVVEKNNREVLRLFAKGECRPFVPRDEGFEKQPFGAPGLGEFLASQPMEAIALRKCVDRLWLVHQDFLKHMAGEPSPQEVLFRYQHMFKGIKDKFVPVGSVRLQAWFRLGMISKENLNKLLDLHLPGTAAVASR